jgi:hypothetical protein
VDDIWRFAPEDVDQNTVGVWVIEVNQLPEGFLPSGLPFGTCQAIQIPGGKPAYLDAPNHFWSAPGPIGEGEDRDPLSAVCQQLSHVLKHESGTAGARAIKRTDVQNLHLLTGAIWELICHKGSSAELHASRKLIRARRTIMREGSDT